MFSNKGRDYQRDAKTRKIASLKLAKPGFRF